MEGFVVSEFLLLLTQTNVARKFEKALFLKSLSGKYMLTVLLVMI